MSVSLPFDVATQPITSGTFLIEAGAGTGKTYNIQHLFLRLVAERGLKVEEILAVTFTEAATAELRDRIRTNLRNALTDPAVDPMLAALVSQAETLCDAITVRRRLATALTDFDRAAIFTIHGFCKRMLAENAFESGVAFDLEFVEDKNRTVEAVVRDFWRRELLLLGDTFPEGVKLKTILDDLIVFAKEIDDVKVTPEADDADDQFLTQIRRKLADFFKSDNPVRQRHREAHMQTFDDMIVDLRDAIRRESEMDSRNRPLTARIRAKFKAALVDEFQDTDPLQYGIFQPVFGESPDHLFFMIGDPKQAIYGFRGGDIHAYLAARDRIPADHRKTLTRNFRSSPRILNAFNHLFARHDPFGTCTDFDPDPRIHYYDAEPGRDGDGMLLCVDGEPVESPLIVKELCPTNGKAVNKETAEPMVHRSLADTLLTLLDGRHTLRKDATERPVRPSDIAILVSSNDEAKAIRARLGALNIPGIIARSGNVFASPLAIELLRLMEGVAEAGRLPKLKAALVTQLLGFSDADIASAVIKDSHGLLPGWSERFHALRQRWETLGFMAAFGPFIHSRAGFADNASVVERLARAPDAERRLTDLRHLMNLVHELEANEPPVPERLVRRFADAVADASTGPSPKAYEMRIDTEENAVAIMTMHMSKGLEFPIVLVPSLWQRTAAPPRSNQLNTYHRDDTLILPFGAEAGKAEVKAAVQRETLEENLRLAYVAVTRAKCQCILWHGNITISSSRSYANPLNYLFSNDPVSSFLKGKTLASPPHIPGVISRCPFDGSVETDASPYTPETNRKALTFHPLPNDFSVPDDWGIMSYTSIGRQDTAGVVRDHDDDAENNAAESPLSEPNRERTLFADFPRGKEVGICIHELYEKVDFRRIPADGIDTITESTIRDTLRAHGLLTDIDDTPYAQVADMLQRTAHQRFAPVIDGGSPLMLADPVTRTLAEMDFHFPVRGPLDYPLLKQLAKLQADESKFKFKRGMVTGSIDLLIEHGGRYSFLDWKTDVLADGACDAYLPARIESVMAANHYLLQFHLYSLALHLYLKARLPGYDFNTHFGGGYYVFLRGIQGGHTEGGIWGRRSTFDELSRLYRVFGMEGTP